MQLYAFALWHRWFFFLHTLATALSFNLSMNGMPVGRTSVLYPQYFEALPSMNGKTVVVTGSSKGLGYVTALSLAKKGAAVVLLNRRYVL